MRISSRFLAGFRDAPTIWARPKTGERIVLIEQKHIPTIMPIIRDFVNNEITAKAFGVKSRDEILWPMIFNLTRHPLSLAALDKDDIPVSVSMQEVVFRNPEHDDLPHGEIPVIEGEPIDRLFKALHWAEKNVFDNIKEDKSVIGHIVYTKPEYRKSGISSFVCYHALLGLIARQKEMGIANGAVTATNGNSQRLAEKLGFRTVGVVPDDCYLKEDGTKIPFPQGEGNAQVKIVDLTKVTKPNLM